MNIFSFFRNILLNILYLICMFVLVQISGCYSFTGGSVPEHLKTLYIPSINDKSGYGNPQYREQLTQLLVDKFRSDGTFTLVERNGDARLSVSINSIRDETMTVSPGELEKEKKIVVLCQVEYYDAIKKQVIFSKNFTAFNIYSIANAQAERNQSIEKALEQISDDILLGVVSGW
ncbi:MAG: hypothetical protein EPN82_16665 [Bacteroidetes bacterium]|nr:MAG: hypothetical protein EPN82_16665 [Bacteroidota bacterium]